MVQRLDHSRQSIHRLIDITRILHPARFILTPITLIIVQPLQFLNSPSINLISHLLPYNCCSTMPSAVASTEPTLPHLKIDTLVHGDLREPSL